ncbi:MAG: S8 family peptidase, partial [Acidobacteriaceae bacterium]|nr:S8 family peptidase [Acidobacteriaceae bacterium]
MASNEEVDVIIQLADEPERSVAGRREVAFPRPAALQARRPVRELQSIRGLVTRVTGASLASLASDPQVKYISPDREIRSTTNYAQSAVGAISLHTQGFSGQGVGVAVIDSGVFTNHFDLRESNCTGYVLDYSENFVGDTPPDNGDSWGHGTAVAGLISSNGRCRAEGSGVSAATIANSPHLRLSGVAPGATLISLRVLDETGKGLDSNVIRAIDKAIWLKSNQPALKLRVINLSLGRPVRESYTLDPLCQAVERAWKAGIVVVVAAGNRGRTETLTDRRGRVYRIDGYGTIGSPGNDPYVITVGAANDKLSYSPADDVMASYSSKGPTAIDRIVKPDLIAPGNWVWTTRSKGDALSFKDPNRDFTAVLADIPAEATACKSTTSQYNLPPPWCFHIWFTGTVNPNMNTNTHGPYIRVSGTSFAAPLVSGAAALLLAKTPTLTPDAIKARLMRTARKNVFPASTTFTYTNPAR